MKKLVRLVSVVMCLGLCTYAFLGCQPKQNTITEPVYQATMPLEQLANLIQTEVEFAMTMPLLKEDPDSLAYLKDSSGIDTDLMNDFAFRNNMNVTADVLFLAEAKTSADVETILAAFETHKANIIQSFENYLPEPYERAQQGLIARKGNYIMLVISQDNPTALKIFESNIEEGV